jgi:DNA-nicking Smr family endonuclease
MHPDLDSFAGLMKAVGVKPLPPSKRVEKPVPETPPLPTQRQRDDAAVLQELLDDPEFDLLECGDTLTYTAHGIADSTLRQLRRGQFRVQAVIDLHGYNREQARLLVSQFLAQCLDRDFRCVRIIHGKGNGSPNSGPVLKRLIDGWLRRRNDVLAFCTARPADGGSGAVYVLLRRPKL